MVKELAARKNFFGEHPTLQTLYFGGGTPSLLQEAELTQLLGAVHNHFAVAQGAEVTLEANPDDITPQTIRTWQRLGINRISLGVQSFHDEDLRFMRRAHTAQQADAAIKQLQDAGIDNLSVDIIFHLPSQTLEGSASNIGRALSYGVPHLSCYGLTVETRTLLGTQVARGEVQLPDDAVFAAQLRNVMEQTEAAGVPQYEVSNYARPGYESRHNRSYWQGLPYLGIGPSAHSYDGRATRRWNAANLHHYLQGLTDFGHPPYEEEQLDARTRFNEALMTGLRQREGFSPEAVGLPMEAAAWHELSAPQLATYEQQGWLFWQASHLRLTFEGLLRTDAITSALML